MKKAIFRIIALFLVSIFIYESNTLTIKAIADSMESALLNRDLPVEMRYIEDEEYGTDYEADEEEKEETSSPEEPTVTGEDVFLREENVKHFIMSDHSKVAAIYSDPVHFKNEDGNYVDIDNELIAVNW